MYGSLSSASTHTSITIADWQPHWQPHEVRLTTALLCKAHASNTCCQHTATGGLPKCCRLDRGHHFALVRVAYVPLRTSLICTHNHIAHRALDLSTCTSTSVIPHNVERSHQQPMRPLGLCICCGSAVSLRRGLYLRKRPSSRDAPERLGADALLAVILHELSEDIQRGSSRAITSAPRTAPPSLSRSSWAAHVSSCSSLKDKPSHEIHARERKLVPSESKSGCVSWRSCRSTCYKWGRPAEGCSAKLLCSALRVKRRSAGKLACAAKQPTAPAVVASSEHCAKRWRLAHAAQHTAH